jgi:hypothetical protein
MNEIIKNVRHKSGYVIGDGELNLIFCADDAVLIGERENNLLRMLD